MRTPTHNPYNAIAAFQNFAGRPLYVLDAVARALDEGQLAALERTLETIAVELDNQNTKDHPESGKLAEKIRAALELPK
jgi:hypothetical protein